LLFRIFAAKGSIFDHGSPLPPDSGWDVVLFSVVDSLYNRRSLHPLSSKERLLLLLITRVKHGR